jgi:DNA-binding transcriptional LysR family regulator
VGLAELLTETLVLPSSSAVSRRVLDEAVARCGLVYGPFEECDDARTAQAVAASGKGVAVLTDGPRYGAHPIPVHTDVDDPSCALGVPLHVAWDPHHYAAPVIAALARRLAAFLHESAPWR